MNQTIITTADVAATLRVSRPTATRLMSSGAIRSFRVGERSIRTTQQALDEYIRQQQAK